MTSLTRPPLFLHPLPPSLSPPPQVPFPTPHPHQTPQIILCGVQDPTQKIWEPGEVRGCRSEKVLDGTLPTPPTHTHFPSSAPHPGSQTHSATCVGHATEASGGVGPRGGVGWGGREKGAGDPKASPPPSRTPRPSSPLATCTTGYPARAQHHGTADREEGAAGEKKTRRGMHMVSRHHGMAYLALP